jgi:hypothetical protein
MILMLCAILRVLNNFVEFRRLCEKTRTFWNNAELENLSNQMSRFKKQCRKNEHEQTRYEPTRNFSLVPSVMNETQVCP